MITTSPDNVLNYRLNAALVGQPGMTALTNFRGTAMAVDSLSSGFAYVLYHMLFDPQARATAIL
jgi:hypothetical protein